MRRPFSPYLFSFSRFHIKVIQDRCQLVETGSHYKSGANRTGHVFVLGTCLSSCARVRVFGAVRAAPTWGPTGTHHTTLVIQLRYFTYSCFLTTFTQQHADPQPQTN